MDMLMDWAKTLLSSENKENDRAGDPQQEALHQGLFDAINKSPEQMRNYLIYYRSKIDLGNVSYLYGSERSWRVIQYRTPLTWVISTGDIEAARILCDAEVVKVDLNVLNNEMDSETPLHIATRKGYLDIIQLLLTKGADPSIQDAIGYDALNNLIRFVSIECAEQHNSHTKDLRSVFGRVHKAITELVKYQTVPIRTYVDSIPTWMEGTGLYRYIESCILLTREWCNMPKEVWDDLDGIIQRLIEGGAELVKKDDKGILRSVTDKAGNNLLHKLTHYAIYHESINQIDQVAQQRMAFRWLAKLVKLRVPLDAANNEGKTPLQAAYVDGKEAFTQAFEDVKTLRESEFSKKYDLSFPSHSGLRWTHKK